jgi:hypothetical protein
LNLHTRLLIDPNTDDRHLERYHRKPRILSR